MKLEILLIGLILSLCTAKGNKNVNGDLLNIEEEGSGSESNGTWNKLIEKIDGRIDDTENSTGSGDDDDDSEGSGESSGEGSGVGSGIYTVVPISPTVKVSTDRNDQTSTKVDVIVLVTTAIKKNMTTPSTTTDLPLVDVNSPKTTEDSGIVVIQSDDVPDAATSTGEEEDGIDGAEKAGGVNFTVGIIAGVVVGAVLSILIIVFLVYRLRKKDEGSYSLDEPSSAMLRVDTDSTPVKGKDFV